jgi:hypothetical protein
MKVRWTKESLRLRITPSELQMILDGKPVGERLELSGGPGWEAAIVSGANATELAWVGNVMQLNLSQADCQRLAARDAEGIYFRREGSASLRYFVEKDFPCAHPRVADAMETPADTFDPPADFESRKAGGDEK